VPHLEPGELLGGVRPAALALVAAAAAAAAAVVVFIAVLVVLVLLREFPRKLIRLALVVRLAPGPYTIYFFSASASRESST